MRIFQKGFNFSQDGPGNRLVYHLSGCNMRCIWCSNPEGMRADAGIDYAVEELLDECIRSRMLFFSGGGVTFTGGEATVQYEELSRLLKMLKKAGIQKGWQVQISHAGALEKAELTLKALKEAMPGAHYEIWPLSPAFITQGGPSCVAVQYIHE